MLLRGNINPVYRKILNVGVFLIHLHMTECVNIEKRVMQTASHHVVGYHPPISVNSFCQPSKFRSMDGSCNNPLNPDWGKSRTPYGRFLPPDYSDGFDLPRRAKDGFPLPSAREVSLSIARDLPFDHPRLTHLFTLFGQFLNHEVTNKPDTKGPDGESLDCCGKDRTHPECFAIKVPSDDKYYVAQGVKCINLARSIPFKFPVHLTRRREQVNNNTAFIDASTVYGSDGETAAQLRLFLDGKLRTTESHGRMLLLPEDSKQCDADKCFKAGDFRANMLPALTSVHTIWLRQHNRLAKELKHLNPHWDDERIFQEARKIVGAMLQHIVYNEYLPKIFSPVYLKAWELDLLPTGYYKGYDARINPSVANSFAAAAFRFGHTMVRPRFHRITASGIISPSPLLSKEFDNAVPLHHSELDPIVRGMITQHARERDQFFTSQLTEHLFENKTKPGSGQDLFAINIQRGRDNGIPSYRAWRQFCHLSHIDTFEDLKGVMPDEVSYSFQHLYDQVSDIDLYPAGVSEYPTEGGLLGPTFSCIIANQFRNLRKGDQFWYENGNHFGAFTPDQLKVIRQVKFARVICDNTESIVTVQTDVFTHDGESVRLSCEDDHLIKFNLKPWEEDTFHEPFGYHVPPNSIHHQPPHYSNHIQPLRPDPYHQQHLQSPHQQQPYQYHQQDKPYEQQQNKPYQEAPQQPDKPHVIQTLLEDEPYETEPLPDDKPYEARPLLEDKPYNTQPLVQEKPYLQVIPQNEHHEDYKTPQLQQPQLPYQKPAEHIQQNYQTPASLPSLQQTYQQDENNYKKPKPNDQKPKPQAVQAYRPGGNYYVVPGYVYPMYNPSYGMYQLPVHRHGHHYQHHHGYHQQLHHSNYTPSFAFHPMVPSPSNFIPSSLVSLYANAHHHPPHPWFRGYV